MDLLEERKEVIQALLELDCIPVGMELFPASDDDQWSFIKSVIDDCDYYVLILAGRYGSCSETVLVIQKWSTDMLLRRVSQLLRFYTRSLMSWP
jgi:hypothetical protein